MDLVSVLNSVSISNQPEKIKKSDRLVGFFLYCKKTLFIKIGICYNIHIDKKFSPGGGVPPKAGKGVKKRTIDLQPSPPLRGPPRPGRGIKKRNKERRNKMVKNAETRRKLHTHTHTHTHVVCC